MTDKPPHLAPMHSELRDAGLFLLFIVGRKGAEISGAAADTAEGSAGQSEDGVRLVCGIFVEAVLMVDGYHIVLSYLPFFRTAEGADGGGEGKDPIGVHIVTWSYAERSVSGGTTGISHLCIPNLPHHQKPRVPAVLSVDFIS